MTVIMSEYKSNTTNNMTNTLPRQTNVRKSQATPQTTTARHFPTGYHIDVGLPFVRITASGPQIPEEPPSTRRTQTRRPRPQHRASPPTPALAQTIHRRSPVLPVGRPFIRISRQSMRPSIPRISNPPPPPASSQQQAPASNPTTAFTSDQIQRPRELRDHAFQHQESAVRCNSRLD